jgi:hypothetical protein
MTPAEMRRAAEYLTEQARMYRAAGAPVAATERSILAAKLRAMADTGWQPIETAPRDGTCVLQHYLGEGRAGR